ncbi:hypothetical protein EDB83DRAFT_2322789 [Lactarius deliciosus]|nr:hypothetical protein EDB83DRAFT_2322789 [Lactarius deliciosus]
MAKWEAMVVELRWRWCSSIEVGSVGGVVVDRGGGGDHVGAVAVVAELRWWQLLPQDRDNGMARAVPTWQWRPNQEGASVAASSGRVRVGCGCDGVEAAVKSFRSDPTRGPAPVKMRKKKKVKEIKNLSEQGQVPRGNGMVTCGLRWQCGGVEVVVNSHVDRVEGRHGHVEVAGDEQAQGGHHDGDDVAAMVMSWSLHRLETNRRKPKEEIRKDTTLYLHLCICVKRKGERGQRRRNGGSINVQTFKSEFEHAAGPDVVSTDCYRANTTTSNTTTEVLNPQAKFSVLPQYCTQARHFHHLHLSPRHTVAVAWQHYNSDKRQGTATPQQQCSVATQCSDATTAMQHGDTTMATQHGNTMTMRHGDAMTATQHGDAITMTQRGDALTETEHGDATTATQSGSTMTPTWRSNAMTPTQRGNPMTPTQHGNTTTPTQRGDATTRHGNASTPPQHQNSLAPCHYNTHGSEASSEVQRGVYKTWAK